LTVLAHPYTKFALNPPSPAFPKLTHRFRPLIPVTLVHGGKPVSLYAIVDSGADTSIFGLEVAKFLGIDVHTGTKEAFCGTSGKEQIAYYHDMTLQFRDGVDANTAVVYRAIIGFTDLPEAAAGLLGQVAFFDHFVVTFSQKKEQVLLRYDS